MTQGGATGRRKSGPGKRGEGGGGVEAKRARRGLQRSATVGRRGRAAAGARGGEEEPQPPRRARHPHQTGRTYPYTTPSHHPHPARANSTHSKSPLADAALIADALKSARLAVAALAGDGGAEGGGGGGDRAAMRDEPASLACALAARAGDRVYDLAAASVNGGEERVPADVRRAAAGQVSLTLGLLLRGPAITSQPLGSAAQRPGVSVREGQAPHGARPPAAGHRRGRA
jgi:hypothetical protein